MSLVPQTLNDLNWNLVDFLKEMLLHLPYAPRRKSRDFKCFFFFLINFASCTNFTQKRFCIISQAAIQDTVFLGRSIKSSDTKKYKTKRKEKNACNCLNILRNYLSWKKYSNSKNIGHVLREVFFFKQI